MNKDWTATLTDDKVSAMISEISRVVAKSAGQSSDRKVMKACLSKMRPTTIHFVHAAIKNSDQPKLLRGFQLLIAMGAEESLRHKARYWEVFENPVSSSVNESMVFKYIDAPVEADSDASAMAPYVAKAHALCALANAFWLVTGNVNRVREIEECYPEHVELFVNHPERAVELARLMSYGKATSVSELQYYLDLHPAVTGGAL
jgi:hypothetical protein